MHRSPTRWALILVACLFAGCGPASGIQPGIPPEATTGEPVNPTPDMVPKPRPAKS